MSAPIRITPENQSARTEVDSFSSISLKYGFLFGLNKGSRILLVGEYFQAMSHDLAQSYATVDCITQPDALNDVEVGGYDLVCLDAYSRWTDSNIAVLIRTARSNLSPGGTLVLAATNRMSVERIFSRLRGRAVSQMRGLSPWGYKKALKAAGFSSVHEFVVLPMLRSPEEYIDAQYGDIELPGYVSLAHKMFCALGIYRHLHCDYLYVASTAQTTRFADFASVVGAHTSTSDGPRDALRVERFDLRDRGALMFMLSDRAKKRRYVARVAVSERVDAVIARNKMFTDRICALEKLDSRIIGMVPKTITKFDYRGCHVYVENRIAGVLVWKVGRDLQAEKVAYRDAFDFIHAFNLATRQEAIVDLAVFHELLGSDLALIKAAFSGVAINVDTIISRIELRLHAYFTGRRLFIVWGHGDYGYGNILCERGTGHVQGVIDWDTHVEKELAGVDLCNLLLQKNSIKFAGDIARTMEILDQSIIDTGRLDSTLPGYGKEDFDLDVSDLTICLCVAGLRMVKRSIPYTKEFLLGLDGYSDILRTADRILDRTVNSSLSV